MMMRHVGTNLDFSMKTYEPVVNIVECGAKPFACQRWQEEVASIYIKSFVGKGTSGGKTGRR